MNRCGQLAEQVAEGIRELNHLTRKPSALVYPADLYEVTADLMLAAQRMPQLFAQLSGWLIAETDAGHVAHDSGDSPRTWIDDVLAAFTEASDSADELAAGLRRAHEAASGLKAAGAAPGERY